MRDGREESSQSERATYICKYEWLARSDDGVRKKLASRMVAQAEQLRGLQVKAEIRALNDEALTRICTRLEDLSGRWEGLEVGQSMMVRWPRQS